ncbi:MAG: hypothetical protein F4Y44_03780 [Chloroflexi bacterium]|nr:hypothetical protein [Chloroflexota bacterium]
MLANDNINEDPTVEIYDLELLRNIEAKRESDELNDTDRVSAFGPDDTVRLYSPFGHGASDEVFSGICRANFIALNPEPFGEG